MTASRSWPSTNDPDGYVIPADENYQQVLDNPYAHGVRYMVVIPPGGPGALYILNRYYPGLYPAAWPTPNWCSPWPAPARRRSGGSTG